MLFDLSQDCSVPFIFLFCFVLCCLFLFCFVFVCLFCIFFLLTFLHLHFYHSPPPPEQSFDYFLYANAVELLCEGPAGRSKPVRSTTQHPSVAIYSLSYDFAYI